jgi:hypothetical protein
LKRGRNEEAWNLEQHRYINSQSMWIYQSNQ